MPAARRSARRGLGGMLYIRALKARAADTADMGSEKGVARVKLRFFLGIFGR